MTDNLAVYDTIAAALARRCEPDLSIFDPADVDAAMAQVLTFPGPRARFLSWLGARDAQLSAGRISLEARADDATGALSLRVVSAGEQFAEPVDLTAAGPVVRFPMRGGAPPS